MKVVLLQSVPALGERGGICEVADGYARNFLFPGQLAEPATEAALARSKENEALLRKMAEQDLAAEQGRATALDGYELQIEAPVSEEGTLYGSVGAQKVSAELRERGFAVKKTAVHMQSIKEPGEYKATIKFTHGLESEIDIIVTKAP